MQKYKSITKYYAWLFWKNWHVSRYIIRCFCKKKYIVVKLNEIFWERIYGNQRRKDSLKFWWAESLISRHCSRLWIKFTLGSFLLCRSLLPYFIIDMVQSEQPFYRAFSVDNSFKFLFPSIARWIFLFRLTAKMFPSS